jgi:hypothetical protein
MAISRASLEHTPDGHHRLITVATINSVKGSPNFSAYFQSIAAMCFTNFSYAAEGRDIRSMKELIT